MSHPVPDLSRWFAEELQPHEADLRAWIAARFPRLKDADDLVQEAYSRVLRARATGEIACPRAFLFVTVRNLALNQLRQERSAGADAGSGIDAAALVDGGLPIPERLAHAEDLALLVQAIDSLPERCRQVLTLRKICGLSQREVAAVLGVSEHTVESQGSIGLEKCIRYFRRHGYGGGAFR